VTGSTVRRGAAVVGNRERDKLGAALHGEQSRAR
jgi:hypothetical protein